MDLAISNEKLAVVEGSTNQLKVSLDDVIKKRDAALGNTKSLKEKLDMVIKATTIQLKYAFMERESLNFAVVKANRATVVVVTAVRPRGARIWLKMIP